MIFQDEYCKSEVIMLIGMLIRDTFDPAFTLGRFKLVENGSLLWWCETCEDTVRGSGLASTVNEWKVKGASAIPYGTYTARWTMSARFGRNMYELQSVPGFQGIRIHAGNTEKDTEGCLLFGMARTSIGVSRSQEAIKAFEAHMCLRSYPSFELSLISESR